MGFPTSVTNKIRSGLGALADRYTDDDDTISWTNVGRDALMASTAYAALNPNDSETIDNFMGTNQQGPVGYMGGIPNYTATRSLVDDAFTQTNPATSTEAATARRPGSMGRQYFTDTTYAANVNEPIMGQRIKTPEEIAAEEAEAEANQAIYESLMGDAFDARVARGTPNTTGTTGGATTDLTGGATTDLTGGTTTDLTGGTGNDTSNAGLITTFVNTLDLATNTVASNQANVALMNASGYTLAEIAAELNTPLETVQNWFDYYSTGSGSVGYVAPLTEEQIAAQNAATINSGAKTALIASGFIDNGDGTLTSPSGVINRPNATTGQFEGDVFGIYNASGNMVSTAATFDSLVSSMVSGNSLTKGDWITLSNSGKTVEEITAALNARNANTTIEGVTASIEAAFNTGAADKIIADKAAADKIIANNVAAEKVAADKIIADRIANDVLDPYERTLVDGNENYSANEDGTVTDIASGFKFDYVNGVWGAVTDDDASTIINNTSTTADKAAADKIIADKAAADKAAADKIIANNVAAEKAAADKIIADRIANDVLDPYERTLVDGNEAYSANEDGTVTDTTTGSKWDYVDGTFVLVAGGGTDTVVAGGGTDTVVAGGDDASTIDVLDPYERTLVDGNENFSANADGTVTNITTGNKWDYVDGTFVLVTDEDEDDASTIITANTTVTDYIDSFGGTTLTNDDYLAMGNSGFTLAQIASGLSLKSNTTVTVAQLEANIAAASLSPAQKAVNTYFITNDLGGKTPTDEQWVAIGARINSGSLDINALAGKFSTTADQITAAISNSVSRIALNNTAGSTVQNAQGGIVSGYAQGGGIQSQGYYLGGPTDGMADQVPATIDNSQPAALSDGEFVIPADVVSHLGNGNSEAGAENLYDMMERLRTDRTGNPNQGRQINPNEYLA
jgi:hypothetical protein